VIVVMRGGYLGEDTDVPAHVREAGHRGVVFILQQRSAGAHVGGYWRYSLSMTRVCVRRAIRSAISFSRRLMAA
jgi:hypothetical protein